MTAVADIERDAILATSMIVEVATISAKQRPFVTPLWFVEHRGVIYITTGAGSWAGRNVEGHPEIALLFHGAPDIAGGSCLRVRAHAECRPGLPPWRVLWKIARKYYLTPSGVRVELAHRHLWRLRRAYYAQAKGGAGYLAVMPRSYGLMTPPAPYRNR